MSYTGPATVIVRAYRPFTAGPPSNIGYDLWLQTDDGGVLELHDVRSNDKTYTDDVACFGAPVGSKHPAHVSADRLTVWITPVPTYIDCEDIA